MGLTRAETNVYTSGIFRMWSFEVNSARIWCGAEGSAESSFSKMKFIKNRLRRSMCIAQWSVVSFSSDEHRVREAIWGGKQGWQMRSWTSITTRSLNGQLLRLSIQPIVNQRSGTIPLDHSPEETFSNFLISSFVPLTFMALKTWH